MPESLLGDMPACRCMYKRIDILKVNYIINILIIVTFLVSPGRSLNNTFSEYVNFYTVQLQCMSKLLCDSACVNN